MNMFFRLPSLFHKAIKHSRQGALCKSILLHFVAKSTHFVCCEKQTSDSHAFMGYLEICGLIYRLISALNYGVVSMLVVCGSN